LATGVEENQKDSDSVLEEAPIEEVKAESTEVKNEWSDDEIILSDTE
jgi:hypothetical protein